MIHLIEGLAGDWRRLDERIATLPGDQALARQDAGCQGLMGIPGVGAITASALVAAIGDGAAFVRAATSLPGSVWCQTNLDWRSDDSGWHLSARQPIPAHAVRWWRTFCSPALTRLGGKEFRSLADRGIQATASKRPCCGVGQQARSNRLGGAIPCTRIRYRACA